MRRPLLLIIVVGLLGACALPADMRPALTALPTKTAAPAWETLADGLEWRTLIPNGDELAQLIVVRIDPQRFRFRALYSPGHPRRLSEWRAEAPDAAVIINANFFDEAYRALGAVVSDGIVHGAFNDDYGGSFLARDGAASVIVNHTLNFSQANTIDQLVQGYPMLVDQGDPAYVRRTGSQRARRTVIAEDSRGNILILVAPYLGLSLADLSEYLTRTDLNIVRAVNLDGGGSTLIAIPGADYTQPSFDAVPTILAVYPRELDI